MSLPTNDPENKEEEESSYSNFVKKLRKCFLDPKLFIISGVISLFLAVVLSLSLNEPWIEIIMEVGWISRPFIGYSLGCCVWSCRLILKKKKEKISDFLPFSKELVFGALFIDLPMAIRQSYPIKSIKYTFFFLLVFQFLIHRKKWDTLLEKILKKVLFVAFGVIVIGFFVEESFFIPFDFFVKNFVEKIFSEKVFGFIFVDSGKRRIFVLLSCLFFFFPIIWGIILGIIISILKPIDSFLSPIDSFLSLISNFLKNTDKPIIDNKKSQEKTVTTKKPKEAEKSKTVRLIPAEKGETGAEFFITKELKSLLGTDVPAKLGFKLVKKRIEGIQKWGYWAKPEE